MNVEEANESVWRDQWNQFRKKKKTELRKQIRREQNDVGADDTKNESF